MESRRAKDLLRRARKLSQLVFNPAYRRGLRYGVAAAVEHEQIVKLCKIDVLIDIGANVGQFSLLVLAAHPHANVIAFEPLIEPADRFSRLFRDDDRITLHHVATGSAAGEAIIHVTARNDSSSLLPIGRLQKEINGSEEVEVRKINVSRVDDLIDPNILRGAIFVKIDVQGFELEALKGMAQTLTRVNNIYVEISFVPLYEGQPLVNDIIRWLDSMGFIIQAVHNITRRADGTCVQADFLFGRCESAHSS